MTRQLYKTAVTAPNKTIKTTCLIEGPYGARHSLESFGTIVLFAGGVGITHQLLCVRDLITGCNNGTNAAQRICLVWSVQCAEHFEWIRPWIAKIWAMDMQGGVLSILLFVSKSAHRDVPFYPLIEVRDGRPDVGQLLTLEQEQQVGAMMVSVCGPGGLGDEVRHAVRRLQTRSSIDFVEEIF